MRGRGSKRRGGRGEESGGEGESEVDRGGVSQWVD